MADKPTKEAARLFNAQRREAARWEYRLLEESEDFVVTLNRHAREGWELVQSFTVQPTTVPSTRMVLHAPPAPAKHPSLRFAALLRRDLTREDD